MLTPVGEHELLVFWIQLVVLLGAARALGLVAQRFGQPRVVGELAAGVILGPSVFGRLFPDLAAWIFPGGEVQSALLLAIAWLGITMLLMVVGFETDLDLLRRLGRPVVGLSTGSLVIPIVLGFGLGWVMPSELWGPEANRLGFAMFLGVAMSISSLPVIAKILSDMHLMRRNVGQLTLAAAMINDLIGWMLLGVVVGVFAAGSIDLGRLAITVASVVAFLVLGLTVGQRIADASLRRARAAGGYASALTATLLIAFGFAAITQALGVEAVLGALVAGVILGRSRYQRHDVRKSVETLSHAVFAPIFFASAGLYVDLFTLTDPTALGWMVAVLAVGSLTKLAGSFLGGRVSGLSGLESLAAGIGLSARGAMGVILATIGLGLGALNEASYAIVMLLAVLTSMGAPPLMRPILSRLRAAPEESARLEREELLADSVIAGARSTLLPTRGGLNSIVAARVVDALLQPDATVTVLSVRTEREDPRFDRTALREMLRDRPHDFRHEVGDDVGGRILEEAGLGYQLLTIGLNDDYTGSHELSPPIQRTIAEAPVPLLLVRRGENIRDAADLRHRAFRRILLGVTGTRHGRAAEELAFRLADSVDGDVLALHVVTRGASTLPTSPTVERQLTRVRELAGAFGVLPDVEARYAPTAADELVRVADEWQADTIVIGATVRAIDGRPFLGHGTEWLFEHARQTVIGVMFPATDGEE